MICMCEWKELFGNPLAEVLDGLKRDEAEEILMRTIPALFVQASPIGRIGPIGPIELIGLSNMKV